jgi:hypothetical protein
MFREFGDYASVNFAHCLLLVQLGLSSCFCCFLCIGLPEVLYLFVRKMYSMILFSFCFSYCVVIYTAFLFCKYLVALGFCSDRWHESACMMTYVVVGLWYIVNLQPYMPSCQRHTECNITGLPSGPEPHQPLQYTSDTSHHHITQHGTLGKKCCSVLLSPYCLKLMDYRQELSESKDTHLMVL